MPKAVSLLATAVATVVVLLCPVAAVAEGDPSTAPTAGADVSSTTAAVEPTASPTPTPTRTPTPTPTPRTSVAPAPPLAVHLPAHPVLTLPAGDGTRDTLSASITAPTTAPVTLVAMQGRRTVTLASRVRPTAGAAGATARLSVPVSRLAAGAWLIRVLQGSRSATTALRVGSGVARSVTLATDHAAYYPKSPGVASRLLATVHATDETGATLPVHGAVTLTDAGSHRTVAVRRADPGRAVIAVGGLKEGSASVVARVAGPAGPARSSATRTVRLAPTTIVRTTTTLSWPSVQPVVDDQLDTVTITARGWSSSRHSQAVRGSISIERKGVVVRSWTLRSTDSTSVVWDGRVGGRIIAGTYAVIVRERGPDGGTSASSKNLAVTTVHLPYRIRVISRLKAGNQQGLAIGPIGGATRLFVGVDVGGGRSRIDEYDSAGRWLASSPSLALGHAAEIAVGADGLLHVANGGPSAGTAIAVVDPATWTITRTIDASSLGPNGMIAADPAGGFVVFAGTSGRYTLTPMAADGTLGASVHIGDEGLPQGLEVVHGEVWLYSSLTLGNRITRLDATSGRVIDTIELAMPGEGEGEAIDPATGLVHVGCHSPNRFGVLERVVVR